MLLDMVKYFLSDLQCNIMGFNCDRRLNWLLECPIIVLISNESRQTFTLKVASCIVMHTV